MLVSTRGRYAIRVMIDLAEHMNGKYIPMKEIADRQDVSLKYMTKIMQALTKSGGAKKCSMDSMAKAEDISLIETLRSIALAIYLG